MPPSEPFTAPSAAPPAVRRAGSAVLTAAARSLRARDYPRCEALCRQVLDIDPDHAQAVGLLGLAALRGGHPADALPLLRRATQLDPRPPLGWHNLGAAHAAAGQSAAAAEAFRAAVHRQPYHLPSLLGLAHSLRELGLLPDAAAAAAQIMRLDPHHPQARMLLDELTPQLRDAA